MENIWSKLDTGLQQLYSNYLSIQQEGKQNVGWIHPALREDNTQIPVSLYYTGDLPAIEAAGFIVQKDKGEGNAIGLVDLNTLEQVAGHPGVIELRYGLERTLNLDTSVIEITARKAASGAAPFIWDVNRSTGVFSGSTGENVVIGIIDSGIDFTHKNFFKNNTPETRILRIWDMGLTKTATEKSPDVALLDGAVTYGVEYTDSMINDVLQNKPGAKPIRHKDCIGHGTHVASIAAGDGREPAFLFVPAFDFVGVAPKAFLIIVKLLGLPKGVPAAAGPDQRQKDAFSYILKTAAALNGGAGFPVVINCSFGNDLGSHDGLEPDEQTLSKLFDNVPGKACVFAGGNASGKRHHAIITIPAGGSIEVPFDLSDKRTSTKDKDTCVETSNTVTAFLDFWYKDITPGTLKASLQVPGGAFTATVNLNDPELKGIFDGDKRFSITHTKQPPRTRPGPPATNVVRNNLTIAITAKDDALHKSGTYTVKLEGTAGTTVHVWCGQNKRQIFKLLDPLPAAVAPNISVTDLNTISGESCLPNVITVAAYDDLTGSITSFSSQGPVVDYSGAGPIAVKPDLAAPGLDIRAARSATGEFPPEILKRIFGQFYISFNGTSMSAPHITGVVALMLQKNKNLKSNDILTKLKAGIRAFSPAAPATSGGKGKTGAKQTFDSV